MLQRRSGGGHHDVPKGVLHRGSRGEERISCQRSLLKRIESLEQSERESILAKMQGAETPDIDEQNQVLMMLLKVSCEVRQESHKHNNGVVITLGGLQMPATATPSALQSENVLEVAKRAKRSLADSFNTMVRRKASLDITDTMAFITAKETPAKQAAKETPAKQ